MEERALALGPCLSLLFVIPEGNLLLLVILSEAKNPRISPLLLPGAPFIALLR
jgi:hypothetical protein